MAVQMYTVTVDTVRWEREEQPHVSGWFHNPDTAQRTNTRVTFRKDAKRAKDLQQKMLQGELPSENMAADELVEIRVGTGH